MTKKLLTRISLLNVAAAAAILFDFYIIGTLIALLSLFLFLKAEKKNKKNKFETIDCYDLNLSQKNKKEGE